MKKLSLILALFAFVCSSSLIAEAKILTCERNWEYSGKSMTNKWTAVFDTDDFKKDNAKYELTYLKSSIYPNRVGDTYRSSMSVTPTTISFSYCGMKKSLVDSDCNSPYSEYVSSSNYSRTYNVSRKDLTFQGGGQCEIADFGEENIL